MSKYGESFVKFTDDQSHRYRSMIDKYRICGFFDGNVYGTECIYTNVNCNSCLEKLDSRCPVCKADVSSCINGLSSRQLSVCPCCGSAMFACASRNGESRVTAFIPSIDRCGQEDII